MFTEIIIHRGGSNEGTDAIYLRYVLSLFSSDGMPVLAQYDMMSMCIVLK